MNVKLLNSKYILIVFGVLLSCLLLKSQASILFSYLILILLIFLRTPKGCPPEKLSGQLALLVYLPICLALVLYFKTVTSSVYYLWGDEGPALDVAFGIKNGNIKDIFWGLGIFNEHPILGSNVSAFFVYFFGESLNVVRASVMIPSILSGLALFHVMRSCAGSLPALVSLSTYLFGYYHFQFSHLAYNNLWLTSALILPIWSFERAKSTKSPRWAFLGGWISGISVLFTYQAIVIPCALSLSIFIIRNDKSFFKKLVPTFSLGVFCGVLPFLLSVKVHIPKIIYEHLVHLNEHSEYFNISFLINKFLAALCAPLYEVSGHFINGYLYDPISGVGYVVGLLLVIRKLIFKSYSLLDLYVFISLICFSGMNVLSPYAGLSATRLTYLCALVPILIGIFCSESLKLMSCTGRNIFCLCFTGTVIGLNVTKVIFYWLIVSNTFLSDWKLWIEVARDNESIVILPNSHKSTWQSIAKFYQFNPSSTVLFESSVFDKLTKLDDVNSFYISAQCKTSAEINSFLIKNNESSISPIYWPGSDKIAYFHVAKSRKKI